jgi:hypothetical protein
MRMQNMAGGAMSSSSVPDSAKFDQIVVDNS